MTHDRRCGNDGEVGFTGSNRVHRGAALVRDVVNVDVRHVGEQYGSEMARKRAATAGLGLRRKADQPPGRAGESGVQVLRLMISLTVLRVAASLIQRRTSA